MAAREGLKGLAANLKLYGVNKQEEANKKLVA